MHLELDEPELAFPIQISLEEYLRTSFRPDCEYVDGFVQEREMGSEYHSLLQMWLGYWFVSHRAEWKVRVGGDIRTRVSADRVRLPDVAVISETDYLKERVLSRAPLIAIEILSPDDRIRRVIPRLEDLVRMGTEHVWVLDPEKRIAYRYFDGDVHLVQERRLTVPGTPIYLDLPEMFEAALD